MDFIIGYGLIQSSLLIFLLVSNAKKNHKSVRYLVLLLVVISYIVVEYLLIGLGYRERFSQLFYLGVTPIFLIPPLYFLFLSSLLATKEWQPKALLHFVPFLIVLFNQVLGYVLIGNKKVLFLSFVILLFLYSLNCSRIFRGKTYLNKTHITMLRYLNICMILFSVCFSALYLSKILFETQSIDLRGIIVFYLAGFVTILEIHMIKNYKNFLDIGFSDDQRYKNSNLQSQNLSSIKSTLDELIYKEHIYLNSELRPNDLADKLKISRHQLSEFLNKELNCTFNDFLNGYRVEHIKKMLLNKQNKHLSISGLAQEAGFKSSATFYRFFKKATNLTPTEYIRERSQG